MSSQGTPNPGQKRRTERSEAMIFLWPTGTTPMYDWPFRLYPYCCYVDRDMGRVIGLITCG